MRRRIRAVLMLFLAVLSLAFAAGCAGTMGAETSNDPDLIRKEIVDIEMEIGNTEELLKGNKAQLQIESDQNLLNDIRTLEMNLMYLESRKRALEERLAELAAE
jgi:hypothetical protein